MRESATPYVLLGILALFGPSSGYEIRAVIRQSVGHFWSESFGQIYPHLRRLAEKEFIHEVAEEDSPRDRRRFAITDRGLEELKAWIRKPPQPRPPRSELAVKIFFGALATPSEIRSMLQAEFRSAKETYEICEAGQLLTLDDDINEENLPYFLIITDAGRLMANARARWAERALSILDAQETGGNKAVIERLLELRTADVSRSTDGLELKKSHTKKKKKKRG